MTRETTLPVAAVRPGGPYPRGATWDGEAVNSALFCGHAERVELCIVDATGRGELQRVALSEQTELVRHAHRPEARPGMLRVFRVYGPYDSARRLRFDPRELLLEPYAKSIKGGIRWGDAHFGDRIGSSRGDLSWDRASPRPTRGDGRCATATCCCSSARTTTRCRSCWRRPAGEAHCVAVLDTWADGAVPADRKFSARESHPFQARAPALLVHASQSV